MTDEITPEEYRALLAPSTPVRARGARKGRGGSATLPRAPGAAQTPTEHAEQAALIAWADGAAARVPELGLLFAIPNGARTSMSVARRLKAEGLRAGVPDLLLPVPRPPAAGLFVELKRRRDGVVSPEQRAWHVALQAQGYAVQVCKGWEAAARAILAYLGRRPEEEGL